MHSLNPLLYPPAHTRGHSNLPCSEGGQLAKAAERGQWTREELKDRVRSMCHCQTWACDLLMVPWALHPPAIWMPSGCHISKTKKQAEESQVPHLLAQSW